MVAIFVRHSRLSVNVLVKGPSTVAFAEAVITGGVNAAVPFWTPLIMILSKRQLPEVLFKGAPWLLTQDAPVEAFTMRMPKCELLAASGSLIVAVRFVNHSCPLPTELDIQLT